MSMAGTTYPGELDVGLVIDSRYRILRELGRGGMGAVYEAEQFKLQKRVALKVLTSSSRPGDGGDNRLHRFLREARAASSIKHRNVVDIIDYGDIDGRSNYYVMELLKGRDLSMLLKSEGPMAWPRLRVLLRQVLQALAAAHAKNIIHRDIKPANIMLLDEVDEWGQEWVKVLDFGIAKVNDDAEAAQALTGTSELLGTAGYMAPELARGDPPDARADLYALGIAAYQLLTGVLPFTAPNLFQVLLLHINEPPKPPRALVPDLPVGAENFILRALAKEPADRHASALDMIAELDTLGGPPIGIPSGEYSAPIVVPVARGPSMETPVAASPLGETVALGPPSATARVTPHVALRGDDSTVPTDEGLGTGAPPSTRRWAAMAVIVVASALAAAIVVLVAGPTSWTATDPSSSTSAAVAAGDRSPQPPNDLLVPAALGDADAEAESSTHSAMLDDAAETSGASTGIESSSSSGSPPQDASTPTPSSTPTPTPTSSKRCNDDACRLARAKRRLSKTVRRRCAAFGTGQSVGVSYTVGPDGRVLMPQVARAHAKTELGECVLEQVVSAQFPPQLKLTPQTQRFKP